MAKIRIDFGQFRKRCIQTELEIVQSVKGIQEIRGNTNSCWFKDNGSDILMVAHMDTVQKDAHFSYMKILNDSVIYSPKLDDRAGVYTILDLLPRLGIKADILLTTDEETCNTSAKLFTTDKKYKWIAEFDRMGEDVVCYGMNTPEFTKALTDAKFTVGFGSYSDICDLDTLGCCAMNVGVGYANPHSIKAHMFVGEYVRNIKRFLTFYNLNKSIPYPKVHVRPQSRTSYAWDGWDDDIWLKAKEKNEQVDKRYWKDDIANEEYNEITGNIINTDKQFCPQCGYSLDYYGNGYYECWGCEQVLVYNYHNDKIETETECDRMEREEAEREQDEGRLGTYAKGYRVD